MRDFPNYDGPMWTWPRIKVMPDVPDTLAALRPHWTLALATNAEASEEVDIRKALERGKIAHYFDHIYCYRKLRYKKPSPAFFDAIVDDLDIPRQHLVMVGDSFDRDVMGAVACGIRGVWWNQHSQEQRDDTMYRTIQTFSALPDALAAFEDEVK